MIFFPLFFFRSKWKFSAGQLCRWEPGWSLPPRIPALEAGELGLCHTPSRAKTSGTSGGSCCDFEMVWGFLLCQKSCWGGNWRCIVETSTGAQEMTSLQELVITVMEFALDFYFQVLWGMPQAWISCLCWAPLCIQVHLRVIFPH